MCAPEGKVSVLLRVGWGLVDRALEELGEGIRLGVGSCKPGMKTPAPLIQALPQGHHLGCPLSSGWEN